MGQKDQDLAKGELKTDLSLKLSHSSRTPCAFAALPQGCKLRESTELAEDAWRKDDVFDCGYSFHHPGGHAQ